MGKNKIPDGWSGYTPVGKQISNTRFICFKVPLKDTVLTNHEIPNDERFSPSYLLKHFKDNDIRLGLVMDLTNTARYYNPQEFTNFGIEYEKIYTEGHVVPSKGVVEKFSSRVEEFLADNANNKKVIGVHCTHGLNRTGYMVCKYMIDKLGFTADSAIKAFNTARGHNIERENYISALLGRESPVEGVEDEAAGGRDLPLQTERDWRIEADRCPLPTQKRDCSLQRGRWRSPQRDAMPRPRSRSLNRDTIPTRRNTSARRDSRSSRQNRWSPERDGWECDVGTSPRRHSRSTQWSPERDNWRSDVGSLPRRDTRPVQRDWRCSERDDSWGCQVGSWPSRNTWLSHRNRSLERDNWRNELGGSIGRRDTRPPQRDWYPQRENSRHVLDRDRGWNYC